MAIARFFFAHAKDQEDLEAMLAELRLAVVRERPKDTVEVIPGMEDHEKNFARCGSWDGWAQDIVLRCDPTTRKPHYAALVLWGAPGMRVGAATFKMISTAISKGRPVFFYQPHHISPWQEGLGELGTFRAARTTTKEGTSFKDGWAIW